MNKSILHIESGEDTPLIEVASNNEQTTMLIQGISMPENTLEFYEPLKIDLDRLLNYQLPLTLTIKLDYMNSMSNKQIIKLIDHLRKSGKQLNVIWKHEKNDDLIKLKGEEIMAIFKDLSFSVIED